LTVTQINTIAAWREREEEFGMVRQMIATPAA
jgi:hypothetical protein